VNAGDGRRQVPPAVHVGEVLRKAAHPVSLFGRGRHAQSRRVGHERLHRQDRLRKGSQRNPPENHHREHHGANRPREPPPQGLERNAAGSEQHGVRRDEVVGLCVGREHHGEHGQVGEADCAEGSAAAGEQQVPQACEPHHEGRCRVEGLRGEVLDRRQGDVLALHRVSHELQRRPPVRHLPEHVRQEDRRRDQAAGVKPRAPERTPVPGGQEPRRHAEAEEEDAHLVLKAEARNDAEQEPEPLVAGAKVADRDPPQDRPDQQVERVHREDTEEAQERRDQHR